MRWAGDKGGAPPNGPGWNEEKIATLHRHAYEWSASEFVRVFGDGTTRNAVIGKLHRLGLKRTEGDRLACVKIGQAKGAATKRAKSERQRVVSAEAIVERRAEQQIARTRRQAEVKTPQSLAEHREKQAAIGRAAIAKIELTLIENQAFVAKVEEPPDLYAHMRSEEGLSRAIAALSR